MKTCDRVFLHAQIDTGPFVVIIGYSRVGVYIQGGCAAKSCAGWVRSRDHPSTNRSGFIQISKTPSHEGGKFRTPAELFTIYYLVMVSLDRLTLRTQVGWVTARVATPRGRKVYKETFLPSLRSCSFCIPSWLPDGISQVVIRTWCPPNP